VVGHTFVIQTPKTGSVESCAMNSPTVNGLPARASPRRVSCAIEDRLRGVTEGASCRSANIWAITGRSVPKT
jgi:hypothetical protein